MQGWFERAYYLGDTSNVNPCLYANGGAEILWLFENIREKYLRPF